MSDDTVHRTVAPPPPGPRAGALLARNRRSQLETQTEAPAATSEPVTPQDQGLSSQTGGGAQPYVLGVTQPAYPQSQEQPERQAPPPQYYPNPTGYPTAPEQTQPQPAPARRKKVRITVDVYPEDRERLRGMFRATRAAEEEDSFNEMLVHAIMAEAERREQMYNGGVPFQGNGRKLPTGRPIG